jgi:acyl-CoA hydrolase
MEFLRPVQKGEVLKLESKVVFAGRTSLVVYVQGTAGKQMAVKGFISFVNVDENGKPQPHAITITPDNETDLALQKEAEALRK